jgi:hypothetical protein
MLSSIEKQGTDNPGADSHRLAVMMKTAVITSSGNNREEQYGKRSGLGFL